MLRRMSLCGLGALLLVASAGASSASAQLLGPGAYGLGFYNYNGGYASNYRIPYYALFPPVYYSYPVARTYGYSPFAYPPGTRTPELTPPVAAVQFHNPYVQPKASGESPSESSTTTPAEKPVDKSASLPRMYYNPYVKQAATQTASTQ